MTPRIRALLGLTASTALIAGMVAAVPAAQADGWASANVTSSNELFEPRSGISLQRQVGSAVVDSSGVQHVAYVDQGAIKVISGNESWGNPVTAVSAADINDLDDFHLATQGNALAVVFLDQTPRGIKRIRVSQLISNSWQLSDTLLYSKASTPRDITVTTIGSTLYVAFADPQSVIASNYAPEVWQVPLNGAPTQLPAIDGVTRIGDGFLTASGPNHLAYAWLQQDGPVDLGPFALTISFFDTLTQSWSAPEVIDERVYELDIVGTAEPAKSGASGMLVWESTAGDRDRRIRAATLRSGDLDAARAATPDNVSRADDLRVIFNTDADSAIAVCRCPFTQDSMPAGDFDRNSIRSMIIPGEGEIPAFTVIAGRDVDAQGRPVTPSPRIFLDAEHLNLAGPMTGRLAASIGWEEEDGSTPTISLASYGLGGWSSVSEVGQGQWPLAIPTANPNVLTWGLNEPYSLTQYTATHEPRPNPPAPEGSVVIIGSRAQARVLLIEGTTTNIADGTRVTPKIRMVKRGKKWQTLNTVTVASDDGVDGSFTVRKARANKTRKFRAYVLIDDLRSNTVTIGKG